MDARAKSIAVSYVKDILVAEIGAGMHPDVKAVDARFVKLCAKVEKQIDDPKAKEPKEPENVAHVVEVEDLEFDA